MVQESNCSAIVVFDIDGVIRDVTGSYRRAIADTVEQFTNQAYRPESADIDALKSEGIWNNDWEASQELIYRYFESIGQQRVSATPDQKVRSLIQIDYNALVDFFQSRYRGTNSQEWNGYICDEPLLLQLSYLEQISAANIPWGFFSGAPHAEAAYVLERRLGINSPVLIAMEDAPGKPDPTGLITAVQQLEQLHQANAATPVVYVGDTVADMYTVTQARVKVSRTVIGVGILPPHLQATPERRDDYAAKLLAAGASVVFSNVQELTIEEITKLTINNDQSL
ncbi:TIGR01548 family HAD-type hydrolase [Crinalium epipsammum]|uniref:TIGR01548 family HAD-type hydrolase n=1 Tax=Crinalium epipsammum TaxID=241425 RepID=UPI000308D8A1|nr:TIGR01548 family HAD-type hydrolase [Crinalium epipsammum]